MNRRVVITGLGIISPIGNNVFDCWNNLIFGKSGISNIMKFDASKLPTCFAGEVKNFDICDYISKRDAIRMNDFMHYGIAAGIQAIEDSQIKITRSNSHNIGIIIGSGMGNVSFIEQKHDLFLNKGSRCISPYFISSSIMSMISSYLSIKFGIKGPVFSISSACATGLHCIGESFRLIMNSSVDVMIAGASESAINPLIISGFSSARVLSRRNDSPSTASRPWDRDRDGFVIGEGSGIIVLEEYNHAKLRNAKIYAEIIGYGINSDAYHITTPSVDGAYNCMKIALKYANVHASSVNYLNAHGTSTLLGDFLETQSIKRVFGSHAKKIVINSTKSMTGHLLGAAGVIESIFTILAIYYQISPPTINIFNQDPDCDLDFCANYSRNILINVALKNSFGFGGVNGTLLFSNIK